MTANIPTTTNATDAQKQAAILRAAAYVADHADVFSLACAANGVGHLATSRGQAALADWVRDAQGVLDMGGQFRPAFGTPTRSVPVTDTRSQAASPVKPVTRVSVTAIVIDARKVGKPGKFLRAMGFQA